MKHHLEIRTRVFELAPPKYASVAELARAMGLSVSQLYRVREGKRKINQKFIVGALQAFPDLRMDQLFYVRHTHGNTPRLGQSDPALQYLYMESLCRLVADTLCNCRHLQDAPGSCCHLQLDCNFFSRRVQMRLMAVHKML